jgi:S1-C subfamily serine protease
MKRILLSLFMTTWLLSTVAVAESALDSQQLRIDYKEVERRYREAVKAYQDLSRDIRADPLLQEALFGNGRPTTGLRLEPISDGPKGVMVYSVTPGSLAEQAGMRAKDRVLMVNGERFDETEDPREALQMLLRLIAGDDVGTPLRIEYLREGQIRVTDTRTQTSTEIALLKTSLRKDHHMVKPMNRYRTVRDPEPQRVSALDGGAVSHWSGLTFVNMTPLLGQYFGVHTGVLLVHSSDTDLPLLEGDVILKIDRQIPVNASEAVLLLQNYNSDEPVALEIWRYRQSLLLEFKLKQNRSSSEHGVAKQESSLAIDH